MMKRSSPAPLNLQGSQTSVLGTVQRAEPGGLAPLETKGGGD